MEPPSRHLVKTLSDLQLCTAADLRACRGRVRRLARDLPAFDSVWIDALLQTRRITPFQAHELQSHPERLRIGPCLLLDRLGRSRTAESFLARRIGSAERSVLKAIRIPADQLGECRQRLETAVRNLAGWQHPAVVAPYQCLTHGAELVALSRPVAGPHLRELLVRRGRFPAEAVVALAAQLVDGLAHLEARGEVHGDIRLNNIRLTAEGQAVLVDAAIAPAVSPELTIHAALPPHRYDGAAPELIGTGRPPTAKSDIYALGCVLWELLAGRPPFPTGDPLGKLVSHQSRPVPDVREWAPDTPARLAEAIAVFTARNPDDRPRSFREVRDRWDAPGARQRRRLRQFRAKFSSSAPATSTHASSSARYWSAIVALVFLLSGLSLTLIDNHARSEVLSFGGRAKEWVTRTADASSAATPDAADDAAAFAPPLRKGGQGGSGAMTRTLPQPDATGTITLPDAGPWEAAEIALAGPLTIRGSANKPAEIVIGQRPLSLRSERVRLEHIRFSRTRETPRGIAEATAEPAAAGAFVAARCRDLIIRNCEFDSEPDAAGAEPTVLAIHWAPLSATDRRPGRILLQDTIFLNGRPLEAAVAPGDVQVRNVLAAGTDALLTLATDVAPASTCRLQAARLTLRAGGGLVRLPAAGTSTGRIAVDAVDCVFDLRPTRSAIFLFDRSPPPGWADTLELAGEGSLVSPEIVLAASARSDGPFEALDASSVSIDGLIAGTFEFAAAPSPRAADSAVRSFQAPRRSAAPPGIDPLHIGAGR